MNILTNSEFVYSNGQAHKRLGANNPYGQRLIQHMVRDDPGTSIENYLAALMGAGVRLPPGLQVEEEAGNAGVRHTYVTGSSVRALLATAPDHYWGVIEEIGEWAHVLHSTHADAHIDTNLTNFIIGSDGPVLVDVLPPLFYSRRYEPTDLYETLLLALCFNDAISVSALLGYAVKPLLSQQDSSLAAHIRGLADRWGAPCDAPAPGARVTQDTFVGRLCLALAILDGKAISPQAVRAFFHLTSLRRLVDLTEGERRDRIARAWSLFDAAIAQG